MKAGGNSLLEAGVGLVTLSAPLLFGLVYSWGALAVASFLFLLVFGFPSSISESLRLPRIFFYGVSLVSLWILAQLFLRSLNPYATGHELIKWAAFAGGFLLIQTLGVPSLVRWATVLVFVGSLESFYALFQLWSGQEMVLWVPKEFHRGFATGTYFNRNHLAGFLELCLGVHLGLWLSAFHERKLGGIFGFGLLLALSSFALFCTGSRAGVLSLAVSLLFFSFFLLRRVRESRLSFFLFLGLVWGGAFYFGREFLFPRLEELVLSAQDWNQRLLVWQDAFGILRDFLWTGTGLGTFEWIFPSYQSRELTMGWSHVHNDYLELAIEMGLAAFLVLSLSFVTLWWGVLRKLDSVSSASFPLVWGGLVSVTAFFLHGFTDFNWAIPGNALIFIFIFSMAVRFVREERPIP